MSDSDSDDDEHNKRKVCEVGIRTGYESEQDIADNGRKPIGATGLANKKLSTMEWFFSSMKNGKKQVVPCPYVSNDPVQLRMTRPVKMEDDEGNLLIRSIHEKDNPDEPDDMVIGTWTSAVTGMVINIYQFEWRLLGTDFTIAIYGKRRTGKTHIIKAMCFQMRRYYPLVIVFTKTKFNGDLLKLFPDACIFNDLDEGLLERIMDAQKDRVQEAKKAPEPWVNCRMLLVLDDVLSDKKSLRYNEMTTFKE